MTSVEIKNALKELTTRVKKYSGDSHYCIIEDGAFIIKGNYSTWKQGQPFTADTELDTVCSLSKMITVDLSDGPYTFLKEFKGRLSNYGFCSYDQKIIEALLT